MIVLDTNVLSELTKLSPSPQVFEWIAVQPRSILFTTAITQAEMLAGIERLPSGKRRRELMVEVQQMLRDEFSDRILPFDSPAAVSYATIAASRRSMGKPISQSDAQIAAIAHSRGAILATRNLRDFAHCGIKVLNPWDQ